MTVQLSPREAALLAWPLTVAILELRQQNDPKLQTAIEEHLRLLARLNTVVSMEQQQQHD